MKKTLIALGFCIIGTTAFTQNQQDSIHIVLHENQNGTIRVLDTIVPLSQQQALFTWMQANGWEAPPPPPPPGQGPAEFEHVIIIEGDSIPHGDHRMMMMHMQGDSMPPHGCHRVMTHDGTHPHPPMPPGPPHPPGSQVEVNVQHKDTVIDGKKHVMIIRTEKIILPEGVTAPPAPPHGPVPPTPPQGDKKPMPAEKQNDLVVYPNPSTAIISVEFDVTAKEKTTLRVVDMNGKVVYTEEIVENESKHLHREINLSGKTKGTYTVEVKTDKKVIAERVILQ